MPQAVGHAVSIVGALVIGDAAVSAGIIGAPMVIVVAVTAISSFVVPSLYEPVTVLRFAFILIGGLSGVFGVVLALCAVIVNLCAVNPLGVPRPRPPPLLPLPDAGRALSAGDGARWRRRTCGCRIWREATSEGGDRR
ncbi:MAG: spore germination protein [Anaerotruncus massiliensis (ex Togo et al. 2019)]